MKKVALLAVIISIVGSHSVIAETLYGENSDMILAFNSATTEQPWINPSHIVSIDTDAMAKKIEEQMIKQADDMSLSIEKQFEDKFLNKINEQNQ